MSSSLPLWMWIMLNGGECSDASDHWTVAHIPTRSLNVGYISHRIKWLFHQILLSRRFNSTSTVCKLGRSPRKFSTDSRQFFRVALTISDATTHGFLTKIYLLKGSSHIECESMGIEHSCPCKRDANFDRRYLELSSHIRREGNSWKNKVTIGNTHRSNQR